MLTIAAHSRKTAMPDAPRFWKPVRPRCRRSGPSCERVPYAILPVGSTEQHGPHLPLNTDTLIAERIALETARRSVGLVLPAMPLGYAWVWRDVPATLTLRFDT